MKFILGIFSFIFVLIISSCSASFDFHAEIFINENSLNDDLINFSKCSPLLKLCPDGTYVERVAPNCDFLDCPFIIQENNSHQRLVYSLKPIIPNNIIFSTNFDKIVNKDGLEISGQGIVYNDFSYSKDIYRGFNILNNYPQIVSNNNTKSNSLKIIQMEKGEWLEYTIDVLNDGFYLPKIKFFSLDSNLSLNKSFFQIYINNLSLNISNSNLSQIEDYFILESNFIKLEKNLNQVLRLEVLSNDLELNSFWFENFSKLSMNNSLENSSDDILNLSFVFDVNTSLINLGESVKLYWDASNFDSCSAFSSWTGEKDLIGELIIDNFVSSKNYTLICFKDNFNLSKLIEIILINNSNNSSEFILNDSILINSKSSNSKGYSFYTIKTKDELNLNILNETCIPNYFYYSWSECNYNSQYRIVKDLNSCINIQNISRTCFAYNNELENKLLNTNEIFIEFLSQRKYLTDIKENSQIIYISKKDIDFYFIYDEIITYDSIILLDRKTNLEFYAKKLNFLEDENYIYYELSLFDENLLSSDNLIRENILEPIEFERNDLIQMDSKINLSSVFSENLLGILFFFIGIIFLFIILFFIIKKR